MFFILYKERRRNGKNHKFGIFNTNVHKASLPYYLRSTKHNENEIERKKFLRLTFFEPNEPHKNNEENYNLEPLEQTRENFKMDDKQLKKEIARN